MSASYHPADGADPPVPWHAWLARLWAAVRGAGAGKCIRCESDGAFALVVNDDPRAYRLQCARCGWRTPWFDCREGHISVLDDEQVTRARARSSWG